MTDKSVGSGASQKLWQKGTSAEDWVVQFTVGDDYTWDTLLLPYDIVATRAHVSGLHRIGILSNEEAKGIDGALDELLELWHRGDVTVTVDDEDCHTVIERFLTEKTGAAGARVHTGRSRNDQVLAALRLLQRDALASLAAHAIGLAELLLAEAERTDDWLMPGYTHTQRAMPTSLGQWYAGFAECLLDDAQFIAFAAQHVNKSPLGSGAGYGIPHVDLDRTGVAEDLFSGRLVENVAAVQLARGKSEMLVVAAAAQLALTINRLSSDLILYASQDFGFVSFDETVATGSSIMPHKKNPDVLEIARALYHRVSAELALLSSISANLTTGYHRDLQLTKGAVIRALQVSDDAVTALAKFMRSVSFDRERLDEAVSAPMLTAGNALKATLEGTPFREAYRANAAASTRPDASEILAAYRTSGSPGSSAIKPLRARADDLRSTLANLPPSV